MKRFLIDGPKADTWLVLSTMFFALVLLTIGLHLTQIPAVLAASGCWRNTKCTGPLTPSFPGVWDANNFSPSSRTVSPLQILTGDGLALSAYPGAVQLKGDRNIVVYDFGKEIGGIVTVRYSAKGNGTLGLAFSEARNWIGRYSDDSNGIFDSNGHPDGALLVDVTPTLDSNYTMPDAKMRGGFRYLSLFVGGGVTLDILSVQCEISFAPAWSNLRAYRGYFNSSDPLLNKIWYAGAYTLQTNAIPPTSGRRFPIEHGWVNDQQLNLGTTDSTIYVDGSKRDRTVWAGDLAIAVPSILISTGDADGVKNTLQVLLNDQHSTGALPFAGPGLNIYASDTYHMATLIGIYEYFLFTNDTAFMSANWDKYVKAVSYIVGQIDNSGLLFVTGTQDWGRDGQGGHNTEANMLMYKTLTTASSIATWTGHLDFSSILSTIATTLKDAVNARLWDAAGGAFGDSEGNNSRHPQDGNSMALLFGAANESFVQSISSALTQNWISIGSVAPELPNNLVGFGQSFEVKGHLAAHQATRALDLIRRAWGWYLTNPNGTASTFLEGYLTDGSFGYRATTGYGGDYSYTSHAHGWSTGPTDALTSYVVGLRLTSPGGSTWTLAPQFGGLSHAEAGFTTPLGRFVARWNSTGDSYSMSWGFPGGTVGTIEFPTLRNKIPKIQGNDGARFMQTGVLNDVDSTFTIQGVGSSGSLEVFY